MSLRNKLFIVFLLISILILGFYLYNIFNSHNKALIEINGKQIKVEIADSPAERAKGLMFRTELSDNTGMLFIFEQEQKVSFWMKNTLISLDLIFVNENFEIVDIKQDFLPCTQDPCELYTASQPVKYVLEVNAGYLEKNNISIGDKIILTSNI